MFDQAELNWEFCHAQFARTVIEDHGSQCDHVIEYLVMPRGVPKWKLIHMTEFESVLIGKTLGMATLPCNGHRTDLPAMVRAPSAGYKWHVCHYYYSEAIASIYSILFQ